MCWRSSGQWSPSAEWLRFPSDAVYWSGWLLNWHEDSVLAYQSGQIGRRSAYAQSTTSPLSGRTRSACAQGERRDKYASFARFNHDPIGTLAALVRCQSGGLQRGCNLRSLGFDDSAKHPDAARRDYLG